MDKKKKRKRRRGGIVAPVNPLVTSAAGMSAGAGDLMPPAIHGAVSEESSNGIKWIPIKKDA